MCISLRYQAEGNRSMVLAKLLRHLHTEHVDCKDRPIALFKLKCEELKHSQTNLTSVIEGENGNVCEASYRVNYHTARCPYECRNSHETLHKRQFRVCLVIIT
jgi:hypothetical protein